jgi:hypothetical protein
VLWVVVSGLSVWALNATGAAPVVWIGAILWAGLCFAAILGLSDAASRAYIAASLERPGLGRGYAMSTRQRLAELWQRYGTSAEGSRSLRLSFARALTWKLYDSAMLVAVVYPSLVAVGWWIVTGHDARLGDSVILPANAFWPDRAISLAGIVGLALSIPLSWQAKASANPRVARLGQWLPVIGGMVATAGVLSAFNALAAGAGLAAGFLGGAAIAGAGSIVIVGAAALVGAAAVSIATASTMMGAGLAPIGIAIALMVTMAVALDTLDGQGRHGIARWIVTIAVPVGWLAALVLVPWPSLGGRARGLFLFLAVMPLITAAVSVMSYAANLALARQGLLKGRIFLNGLAGLGIALILSAALGFAFALVIALFNHVVGGDRFSVTIIFAHIVVHPDEQFWLLATVLTPIAPALLHAAIALVGMTGMIPARIRRSTAAVLRAAGRVDGREEASAVAAPFVLGTIWIVPFSAVGMIVWAIVRLAGSGLETILWTYVFAVRNTVFWLMGG